MPLSTRILVAATSLLVTVTIVSLVRRKRLDEKYALLWLLAGALMMLAPLGSNTVDAVSRFLGFAYPPSFVFLLAFFVLCLINLQYSVVISRLNRQSKLLSQRLVIMEARVKGDWAGGERAKNEIA